MRFFQVIATLGVVAALSSRALAAVSPPTGKLTPQPPGAVTFSSHIARIIHLRCATCHHEGQSAPFNLVSYEDVRKRARQILERVESRAMPPWLAEHGYGEFSNERRQPTNTCYAFKLGSYALNFPAGATNEIVRDSLVLPVDVDVLAAYPHAHFLGREMQGYAVRPDGVREWLLWIKQWDFNWQGDYRYTKPVHLPKGMTLHLQFSYDNSTNNPVNPNQPPRRVFYGERSSDEMCELGLQVLACKTNDLKVLQETVAFHRAELMEEHLRQQLALNPDDAETLTRRGMNLWALKRPLEAHEHLQRAIKVRPDFAEAHYNKGVFLRFNGQLAEARLAFETALRLDTRFSRAHQQLGFALASLGQLADAERALEKAIELDPADTETRDALVELREIIKSRQRSN
jgi:hypothetical protein